MDLQHFDRERSGARERSDRRVRESQEMPLAAQSRCGGISYSARYSYFRQKIRRRTYLYAIRRRQRKPFSVKNPPGRLEHLSLTSGVYVKPDSGIISVPRMRNNRCAIWAECGSGQAQATEPYIRLLYAVVGTSPKANRNFIINRSFFVAAYF